MSRLERDCKEVFFCICHTFWSHDATLTNPKNGIGHNLQINKLSSHKEGEDKSWHITQANNSPKRWNLVHFFQFLQCQLQCARVDYAGKVDQILWRKQWSRQRWKVYLYTSRKYSTWYASQKRMYTALAMALDNELSDTGLPLRWPWEYLVIKHFSQNWKPIVSIAYINS